MVDLVDVSKAEKSGNTLQKNIIQYFPKHLTSVTTLNKSQKSSSKKSLNLQ